MTENNTFPPLPSDLEPPPLSAERYPFLCEILAKSHFATTSSITRGSSDDPNPSSPVISVNNSSLNLNSGSVPSSRTDPLQQRSSRDFRDFPFIIYNQHQPQQQLNTIRRNSVTPAPAPTPGTFTTTPIVPIQASEISHFSNWKDPTEKWITLLIQEDGRRSDVEFAMGAKPLPFVAISNLEAHLLWRHREQLLPYSWALPRFVMSICGWYIPIFDASQTNQAGPRQHQAQEILASWVVECGIPEALELLTTSNFTCRFIAVQILRNVLKITETDIINASLQLVQCLRYEDRQYLVANNSCALFDFLVEKSFKSIAMTTRLYWYLVVESENGRDRSLFLFFRNQFMSRLQSRHDTVSFVDMLRRQDKLDSTLTNICSWMDTLSISRPKKAEKLRQALDPQSRQWNWNEIFPSHKPSLVLPVNPAFSTTGFRSEEAKVFKSAKQPIMLPCITGPDSTYKVIFKNGDDLRQDQLILNLFTITDQIFANESLNLCMSVYSVVATSQERGFVELVPDSITLADLFAKYSRGIGQFLETIQGDEAGSHENYVKSCAAYSLLTFVLGIGDRHFDNLMIRKDGRMFHIDFGFAFGQDPKPYPPPMRLNSAMVLGMGGHSSPAFVKFRSYCCAAYLALRRSAHVLLNSLCAMLDAGITQLDEAAVLLVRERLCLEADTDKATDYLLGIINKSLSMILPDINESIHQIAQLIRV